MKFNLIHTVLILSIKRSTGYLYRFIKPENGYRIKKMERLPELVPTQMPFYTKKVNYTNTTNNYTNTTKK